VSDQQRPPDVFRVIDDGDIEVIGARLDLPESACATLCSLLSPPERQRADRFRMPGDRCHYVVARARLRQLLGERLRIAPVSVGIVTNDQGKPRLAPAHAASGWEFNLSHSGALAAYAFARGRPVGIDIELIRDIPDADDLAERFFSAAEAAAYRAMPAGRRRLAFLACWTRKEAFVKALGEGLSHPLDAFDVTVDPDEPARITRIGGRSGPDLGWSLTCFRPTPSHIGALVQAVGRDG
jgi:4'-phosphopantetheinyl transferase